MSDQERRELAAALRSASDAIEHLRAAIGCSAAPSAYVGLEPNLAEIIGAMRAVYASLPPEPNSFPDLGEPGRSVRK